MRPQLNHRDPIVELIGEVYEAAQDEALWGEIAPRIARAFDSTSVGLVSVADGGALRVLARTPDFDAAWIGEYRVHFERLTRLARVGLERPRSPGSAWRGGATEGAPTAVQLPCGARLRRGVGGARGIGSAVPIAAGESAVVGIHRPPDAPPYGAADMDRLGRFLPHLQRALRLRHRLGQATVAVRAALDRLGRSVTATLVVDGERRILYANQPADALLRAADGVRASAGQFTIVDRLLVDRLNKVIATAIEGAAAGEFGVGGAMAVPRGSGMPLTVLAAPLRPTGLDLLAAPPLAIIFIRDPAVRPLAPGPLQSLFGLTAAEAAIASALVAGRPLNEVAAGQGISPHTARAHLKSIFGKTGTSRQAGLVALLLSSVAGLASPLMTHERVRSPRSAERTCVGFGRR